MLLIMWLLSVLIQPAPPAVSIVVDRDAHIVSVLNSDARITAIDLHINESVVLVPAPLSVSQKIPFRVPCGRSEVIVYGKVAAGDPALVGVGFSFFQTTIDRRCPVYLPLIYGA